MIRHRPLKCSTRSISQSLTAFAVHLSQPAVVKPVHSAAHVSDSQYLAKGVWTCKPTNCEMGRYHGPKEEPALMYHVDAPSHVPFVGPVLVPLLHVPPCGVWHQPHCSGCAACCRTAAHAVQELNLAHGSPLSAAETPTAAPTLRLHQRHNKAAPIATTLVPCQVKRRPMLQAAH